MHLGSGRLVNQDLTRISQSIATRDFYANPTLKPTLEQAAKTGKAVHLLSLLSPGGVHSHEAHLLALLELAQQTRVQHVFIHAFLDGRDTPPKSAAPSIQLVQQKCKELGVGQIASVVGRNQFSLPFVKNILGEASQQIMQIHVDGTLDNPKIRQSDSSASRDSSSQSTDSCPRNTTKQSPRP